MDQRLLGKYKLQERLGHGTNGNIWKAFDTLLHRYVVVKIVTVNPETSDEFLPRFNSEGQAIAALHHPNIVPVQEFFLVQERNEACIVTDYVDGQSLKNYLDATAHVSVSSIPSPNEIVHLLLPIASALDYAHQHRVLHGALNPSAILLGRHRDAQSAQSEPVLTNFGMHQKRDLRLLPLDDVSYIAPEVAQGYAATSRSDLYSLGVILYELCTGTLPFQGETASDVLMQHIHSAPTSPALINPNIRPALTGIIMRSIARDPAARFSSATSLVAATAKAMNVSVPENISNSSPSLSGINTASFNNSSDPNSPTYLVPGSQLPPTTSPVTSNPTPFYGFNDPDGPTYLTPSSSPSSQSAPVPPTAVSNNTPAWPQPSNPGISASTPLSSVPTQGFGSQPSGSYPAFSVSGTTPAHAPITPLPPVAPFPSQVSGAYPPVTTNEQRPTTASTPQLSQSAPHRLISFATSGGKRRITGFALLIALLLVVLIGSGVLIYHNTTSPSPSQSAITGHAFFFSSGLISEASNQGTTDELSISLQNVPAAQPGKSYYGWLASSYGLEIPALSLGALPVKNGQITTIYSSPQHDNLLANYSRFLVTEEDANQQPSNPSLDLHLWRYYAAFSTSPSMTDPKHYSMLDHLRHLLSQDPKLKSVGLTGGLGEWLFRNTSKILEASGSVRDTEKGCIGSTNTVCAAFMLRQVARILDYLDGSTYVQTENISPAIQGNQLLIDPTIGRVALLEFDTLHQEPPGYLQHIGSHLQSISQIASITSDQRALAIHINQNINNVQGWLNAVHKDASELIHMSYTQLLQPETLTTFNDLFNQANSAFVGQIDPNTDNVKGGVVQIYYDLQSLATFDVAACTMNNGQSSCGGGL
jgi:eukaryotic-like serine/threonine-protein kinase